MKARRFIVTQVSPSYAPVTPSAGEVVDGIQPEIQLPERIAPTMFRVELNSLNMDGVKIEHGNLWITLDTVDDLTQENYQAIRQHLTDRGLLSDFGFLADPSTLSQEERIENLRDMRWSEIVAIRDGLETRGFPYLDKWFDSDERSVARINTTAQAAIGAALADIDMTTDWVCADNSVINLSREQIIGMPIAFAQYCSVLHTTARGLRERIYQAEDAAAIQACKWEGVEV